MDYSSIFENYLYDKLKGNFNNLHVRKLNESTYLTDISYGDEEIETFLDTGFSITLQIDITDVTDTEIGFNVDLIEFIAPGVSETDDDYVGMAVSLYEEVARVAYSCINAINFGSDWVSLN